MAQHQDQVSYSTFFLPGWSAAVPCATAFRLNEHRLQVPRYRTASFSMERKLPLDFYGKASYHPQGMAAVDLPSSTFFRTPD